MAAESKFNDNPVNISQHVPEFSHIPDLGGHFLDIMKTIEEAVKIIEASKEPFWGELIKKLYLDGFEIDQIEEAFKRCNQYFKWKGQICIWYQDSNPTCIQQLQFANGDGKPEYVKKVIKGLIEENCKEDEKKEPEPDPNQNQNQDQPQDANAKANGDIHANANANNGQPQGQAQAVALPQDAAPVQK